MRDLKIDSYRVGMQKVRFSEFPLYLVLFAALLVPTRLFEIYHLVLIAGSLLLLAVYGFSIMRGAFFYCSLIFFMLIIFSIMIGIFVYETNPVRNFSEIIRFVPVLIVLSAFARLHVWDAVKTLTNVFFVYAVICFIVSIAQFLGYGYVDPVTSLYGSSLHIDVSLGISSRALGLSSGPGQNGAMMVVLFTFSLGQMLVGRYGFKLIAIAILSAFVIFLSQSQTSFVVLVGIVIYSMLFALGKLSGELKARAVRLFFILIAFAVGFIMLYAENLRYLFSLFSLGLERNSYQARELKTNAFFEGSIDNVFAMLFGHGKDFYGSASGAMDNEYMFLFGVYGLSSLLMILMFYAFVIFGVWFQRESIIRNSVVLVSLNLTVVAGVVMAWPNAFLLDPRVLFILSCCCVLYLRERKSLTENA